MYRGRPSYGSGGGGGNYQNRSNGSGGGGGGGGGGSDRMGNFAGGSNNKQFSAAQNHHQQNNMNLANNAKNDLPPRFKKMMMTQQRAQGSSEEVSLRPPANSMVLKPKTPTVLPKSAVASSTVTTGGLLGPLVDAALPLSNSALGGVAHSNNMKMASSNNAGAPLGSREALMTASLKQNDATVLTTNAKGHQRGGGSAGANAANKNKDKGPTKEEILQKTEVVLAELLAQQSVEQSAGSLKELKFTDKFWPSALAYLMSKVLDKTEAERELVSQLVSQLKKDSVITSVHFLDGFKELLRQLPDLEKDVPRAKSFVAGMAARAVSDELSTLADIASPLEGGHQYPLFLLTLQQLHKSHDKAALIKLFNDSKVTLMNMLPELDRTKDRLAEILDDRGLSFLFPLLRIQADLWKQIQADPTPTQFYKWIKENLDQAHHTVPGFISALFTVLLKYIVQEACAVDIDSAVAAVTAGTPHVATSSNSDNILASPDKVTQEKEKELIERYRPVLQAFLHDHLQLQVTVLYALQAFCGLLTFPKGLLLRWFVLLYDLEIVEEEAFLKWKEDLDDTTPGKGKALFQVRSPHLNLLTIWKRINLLFRSRGEIPDLGFKIDICFTFESRLTIGSCGWSKPSRTKTATPSDGKATILGTIFIGIRCTSSTQTHARTSGY